MAALPRFDRVIVMKQGAVSADGAWCDLEHDEGIVDIVTQIARPSAAEACNPL